MRRGDEQRARILCAGLRLWPAASARAIGAALGMSHSNVLYHFGNADGLRNAIAAHAVQRGESRVITYLIAEKHAAVSDMPSAVRLTHMVNQ